MRPACHHAAPTHALAGASALLAGPVLAGIMLEVTRCQRGRPVEASAPRERCLRVAPALAVGVSCTRTAHAPRALLSCGLPRA